MRGTVWGPLAPGEDSAVCCVASSSSRVAAGPRGGQGRVRLSCRAQLRAVAAGPVRGTVGGAACG